MKFRFVLFSLLMFNCFLVHGVNEYVQQDTSFVQQQIDSGYICIKSGDYPAALELYFSALKHAEALNYKLGIANAQSALGTAYYRLSDIDKAMNHLKIAEKSFLDIDTLSNGLAKVYMKLAFVYESFSLKDNSSKILKSFSKALFLFEKHSAYIDFANGYESFEDYYYRQAMLDSVEYYAKLSLFDKARQHLAIVENNWLNKDTELTKVYTKMALVRDSFNVEDNSSNVLELYNKALALFEKNGSCMDFADVYNGFAGYYYRRTILDSVEHYAKLALSKFEECGDPQNLAAMSINIAALLNAQYKSKEAIKYNQKGIKIAKEHNITAQLAQGYKNLSETYSYLNDYKNAYENSLLYIKYKKLLVSESKSRSVVEFTKKYEIKEKEKELLIQKNKLKTRNLLLWFLGILSFLGIVFTFLIFRFLQYRKKQNFKLKQLNHTKDKLFSIISHDLKSPTMAQKLAIETWKSEIESFDNDKLRYCFDVLGEYADNQLNIIVSLLNWARTQMGKITYKPEDIDIVEIITEELNFYKLAIQQKSINVVVDVPESCFAFADREMISIVVRNLINNAVKFTKHGGELGISCIPSVEKVTVHVSDRGIGMSKQQTQDINNDSGDVDVRMGTKGEKGTGLGISLCKTLLKANGSKLIFDSVLNEGTTAKFSLKTNK